jgi:hypothetical protein
MSNEFNHNLTHRSNDLKSLSDEELRGVSGGLELPPPSTCVTGYTGWHVVCSRLPKEFLDQVV